jgi:hypothetical protein
MTLFHDAAGPLLSYKDRTFYVSDLNPQLDTKWRMSRREMWAFGWRCVWASIKG